MATTKHSEESEKSIESYLVDRVKELGGKALKYYNPSSTGWPDRVVMLPPGHTFWVELKSKGCLPTSLQCVRINDIKDMGVHVYVCDSKEKVDRALNLETGYAQRVKEAVDAANVRYVTKLGKTKNED